jgi:hypothetical protein
MTFFIYLVPFLIHRIDEILVWFILNLFDETITIKLVASVIQIR